MPEGPEVKIIVDQLNQNFKNKQILSVDLHEPRYLSRQKKFNWLIGCTLNQVIRKAKYLIWQFSSEHKQIYCINHLAMTGTWNIRKFKRSIYCRFSFEFDNHVYLDFLDMRKWGKFDIFTSEEFYNEKIQNKLNELGKDALEEEITVTYLTQQLNSLKERRKIIEIKPLLMEQTFLSGIGNIYASEICFLSSINPFQNVKTLTSENIENLTEAINTVLNEAYKNGGSTIKNYTNVNGEKGNAQFHHMIYGLKTCRLCNSKVLKGPQENRTTFWCPNCQKW